MLLHTLTDQLQVIISSSLRAMKMNCNTLMEHMASNCNETKTARVKTCNVTNNTHSVQTILCLRKRDFIHSMTFPGRRDATLSIWIILHFCAKVINITAIQALKCAPLVHQKVDDNFTVQYLRMQDFVWQLPRLDKLKHLSSSHERGQRTEVILDS